MSEYVYPAIIYPDSEGRGFTLSVPDVNIVTEGETVEEAFLRAKDFLASYIEVCNELDSDIEGSTSFAETAKKNPKRIILLVDADNE